MRTLLLVCPVCPRVIYKWVVPIRGLHLQAAEMTLSNLNGKSLTEAAEQLTELKTKVSSRPGQGRGARVGWEAGTVLPWSHPQDSSASVLQSLDSPLGLERLSGLTVSRANIGGQPARLLSLPKGNLGALLRGQHVEERRQT